ncbi:fused response regulator/phosphatase [uncultured Photobacterium sp.]|uniref:fused response regulator/phosphatase n=1 Tax=uncultured Photobacterium sp. TaxID=173973 RepID=UPI00261A0511|nr:fused response regulator/phosphatase [uncultured Photobacterium sp.]
MGEILLVDDNRATRMFMATVLSKRGYTVTTASDGAQALKVLDECKNIQFVLSDWMMPGMDGIELCDRLKSGDYSRYIFFVLLSGKDDHESIVRGINAGADDFVVKDTKVEEIIARIQAGFRTLALHNEVLHQKLELDQAYATIKKDLDSAADLIRKLLPSKKKLNGVELSYVSVPSAQIGGDMLGYIQLDDNNVAFYLLDVAGHGVSSALMSFSVQQSLSAHSEKGSIVKFPIPKYPYYRITPPHEVLNQLNKIYQSDDDNLLYFTMVYAVLNVKTGLLSYSVAGHPPPVWLHSKGGNAEFVGQDGFVIGAFDFVDYTTSTIQLEPGDKFWVYSDGLTEAENGEQQYTEKRLIKTIKELYKHPTSMLTERLFDRVKNWQQSDQFQDDVSILVMEWTGFLKGEKLCDSRLSTVVNARFFK